MSTPQTIKTQIQTLITRANTATSSSSTDLTTAVGLLIDGYGISKEEQEKTLDIIENGTYTIEPDENKVISIATVNVNVAGATKEEQEKILDVTANGTYNIEPDEGKAISSATVNVNVPSDAKEEQEKALNITTNGEYSILPDDGKALYQATVNVDVPIPDGYIVPTGELEITENGTHDVTNYASAVVNIATSGGGGDFVGIKYSNFDSYRGAPQVADATSLPVDKMGNHGGFPYLFANTNANGNGGWHVLLTDVYLPDGLTNISANMFYGCGCLTKIHGDLSNVTALSSNAFGLCKSLTENPPMPKVKTIQGNAFNTCSLLTKLDFPSVTSILASAFVNCYSLKTLILRSETLCSLGASSAFNNCYHYRGTANATYNPDGLFDGYVYVPSTLVESYQTATNWSSLYANHQNMFRALEDYTVDGTITGELDMSKI